MTCKILVLGAGPVGLASAMLLAREGHEVVVLEKDGQDPPARSDDAWGSWERKGVAQFRATHHMKPRFRQLLETELPEVLDELIASGAKRYNFTRAMPPTVRDAGAQDGDVRFDVITARRPVLESVFARVAQDTPGVKVLRGTAAAELVSGAAAVAGVPHVSGVRTTDGDVIRADLVVDAMGRRSRFSDWAIAVGGRPPYEEVSDTGFAYYTRHYRSRDGSVPDFNGWVSTSTSTFSVLTVPTDNDTWSVAVVAMAGDQPLKALKGNNAWERVVRSLPHMTHWLDGDPLNDVTPMAGVMDRYRRFVIDGRPVLTGMVAVGDAWACTNPMAGRGVSLGLLHAVTLRNAWRDNLDDPEGLVLAFDRATEERLTPWYRQQVDRDYQRASEVRAAIAGRNGPADTGDRPAARKQAAFFAAASTDPDVARAFLDVMSCLALPGEVLARPGIGDKVAAYLDADPVPAPGPTRDEVLALIA